MVVSLDDFFYYPTQPPVSNPIGTTDSTTYQSAITVAGDWKWIVFDLNHSPYTVDWYDADGGILGSSGLSSYCIPADIRVEVYNSSDSLISSSTGDATSLSFTGAIGSSIRLKIIAESPGSFKFNLPM